MRYDNLDIFIAEAANILLTIYAYVHHSSAGDTLRTSPVWQFVEWRNLTGPMVKILAIHPCLPVQPTRRDPQVLLPLFCSEFHQARCKNDFSGSRLGLFRVGPSLINLRSA
jgi:hypothetical protein